MQRRGDLKTEAGHLPPRPRSPLQLLKVQIESTWRKNGALLSDPFAWRVFAMALRLNLRHRMNPAPVEHVIFFSTHHKAMTTYFTHVSELLAFALNMNYKKINALEAMGDAKVFLFTQSRVKFDEIPEFRGVHTLRDPRDIIVSGYHYHQWTTEAWANKLDENGQSYQDKLKARDVHSGLFMEIDHFNYMNRDTLRDWPIDDPRILEAPYEALIGPDREALYARIFQHLGLPDDVQAFGVDLMRLFAIDRRSGRRRRQAKKDGAHIRSGKSGQWRTELTPEHLAYLDETIGDVMRKFGYE